MIVNSLNPFSSALNGSVAPYRDIVFSQKESKSARMFFENLLQTIYGDMLLSLKLAAQSHIAGGISGTVLSESTKKPLEFVNVVVLKVSDSTLVTGGVTDEKGKFQIENVPSGNYFIKYSMLGFGEKSISAFAIDADRKEFKAGTIS